MKEKLLDEAIRYHREEILCSNAYPLDTDRTWSETLRPFEQSFKAGARWHESLPLADRLTEEEKSNLKELHSTVVKTYLGGSHISFDGWFHIMKQIFGDNILDDLYTDKSK